MLSTFLERSRDPQQKQKRQRQRKATTLSSPISRDYFVHDLGFLDEAQVEEHSETRHNKDRKG